MAFRGFTNTTFPYPIHFVSPFARPVIYVYASGRHGLPRQPRGASTSASAAWPTTSLQNLCQRGRSHALGRSMHRSQSCAVESPALCTNRSWRRSARSFVAALARLWLAREHLRLTDAHGRGVVGRGGWVGKRNNRARLTLSTWWKQARPKPASTTLKPKTPLAYMVHTRTKRQRSDINNTATRTERRQRRCRGMGMGKGRRLLRYRSTTRRCVAARCRLDRARSGTTGQGMMMMVTMSRSHATRRPCRVLVPRCARIRPALVWFLLSSASRVVGFLLLWGFWRADRAV